MIVHPAALVESVESVDEVPEERVSAHLAVGHHIEPGGLLGGHGLVNRSILDALELRRGHGPLLEPAARVFEIGGTQKASNNVALHGGHRNRI